MEETYTLRPVGVVRRQGANAWIEIFEDYRDGLLGLEGFSHIHVLFWFHENDTAERRRTLRVHPRRDPSNPLTGVFATHSPQRPNLIGLTRCRLRSVEGGRLTLEAIDADDGSPVIDIKSFIPAEGEDAAGEFRLPAWARPR